MNAYARANWRLGGRLIDGQLLIVFLIFLGCRYCIAASGIGCPHSAADQLAIFSNEESLVTSRHTAAVTKLGVDWAYLKFTVQKVPGLKDGDYLDFENKVDTPMVYYPAQKMKSFWMHRDGEVVTVGNKLSNEGVTDLAEIRKEIREKRFVIAESTGRVPFLEEGIWTNTLIVSPNDFPKSGDLARLGQVMRSFIADFDVGEFNAQGKNQSAFLLVAKNKADESLMAFIEPDFTKKTHHFVAQMHTYESDTKTHTEIIEKKLKEIGKGGDLIVYGDELDVVALNTLAMNEGVRVVRRGSMVTKDLVETAARIRELGSRKFEAKSTALINAVPSNKEQLERMGFPVSGEKEWTAFSSGVDEAMKAKSSTALTSKAELFKELTIGGNDIVMIVAHNDGTSFYLNGEAITFEELSKLPDRTTPSNRPRLAVLVSCCAGKVTADNSNRFLAMFRKNTKGFGELLVEKGFVDEVIAPSHEIDFKEAVSFLNSLSEGVLIRDLLPNNFPGWLRLAIELKLPAIFRS